MLLVGLMESMALAKSNRDRGARHRQRVGGLVEEFWALLTQARGVAKGVALAFLSSGTGIGVFTLRRHMRFSRRVAGMDWMLGGMDGMTMAQAEARLQAVMLPDPLAGPDLKF